MRSYFNVLTAIADAANAHETPVSAAQPDLERLGLTDEAIDAARAEACKSQLCSCASALPEELRFCRKHCHPPEMAPMLQFYRARPADPPGAKERSPQTPLRTEEPEQRTAGRVEPKLFLYYCAVPRFRDVLLHKEAAKLRFVEPSLRRDKKAEAQAMDSGAHTPGSL